MPARPNLLFWRMKHRQQRAARHGRWKCLAMDGREYLFDLSSDERERANLARRCPDMLVSLRERWEQWAGTLPGIPDDAQVDVVGGPPDMPRPSV
jgi:hypothetical protein